MTSRGAPKVYACTSSSCADHDQGPISAHLFQNRFGNLMHFLTPGLEFQLDFWNSVFCLPFLDES